ncbi:MAG TPA: hypothetical protein VFQ42_03935 [Mycobacterium sp.]|nr:hypothetical protein [Mycobacterium sp.]
MTRQPWTIPCGDLGGRLRTLSVRADDNGVALGFPPGESASLNRQQWTQLARVLDIADSSFQLAEWRGRRKANR